MKHVHRRLFDPPNGDETVRGVCTVAGCPEPEVRLHASLDYKARYRGAVTARGAKMSEARRRGQRESRRARAKR